MIYKNGYWYDVEGSINWYKLFWRSWILSRMVMAFVIYYYGLLFIWSNKSCLLFKEKTRIDNILWQDHVPLV